MSAEPLSREERHGGRITLMPDPTCKLCRYEATVQAAEAERDALARRVEALEEIIALFRALDDGTLSNEADYSVAWDRVADAIAADDAARGEA